MDEIEMLLNGLGKATLGITITNAMVAVNDAMRLCTTLDEHERWNKLNDIFEMLRKMNDELIAEQKSENPDLNV